MTTRPQLVVAHDDHHHDEILSKRKKSKHSTRREERKSFYLFSLNNKKTNLILSGQLACPPLNTKQPLPLMWLISGKSSWGIIIIRGKAASPIEGLDKKLLVSNSWDISEKALIWSLCLLLVSLLAAKASPTKQNKDTQLTRCCCCCCYCLAFLQMNSIFAAVEDDDRDDEVLLLAIGDKRLFCS